MDVKVEGGDLRQKSSSRRGQGWLSRPVKVLLISLAVIAGMLDHVLGAWGGPIFVAVAVLVVSILYWRDFRNQIWFWVTMALLAAAQVPLVITMRPLIEQARMFYMGMFLMADCLFVIAVITFVSQIKWKD